MFWPCIGPVGDIKGEEVTGLIGAGGVESGGGRVSLFVQFTRSGTAERSGVDDPFISNAPVAAVTTLCSNIKF